MDHADPAIELIADDDRTPNSQLQAIVEEASRILGRPVAIDDRHLRLIAYTQHDEHEIDRARLLSIMKQPLPGDVFDWMERHGAYSSELPFRTPANAELELDARVGAPIRFQGHHFGLIWCTDRDETMADADLEHLGAFAEEAAVVLYREMLLLDLDRSRERELLRDILSPDAAIRRDAAWQLAELRLFTTGGRATVLVAPFGEPDDNRSSESVRVALEAALGRIRRLLAPKHGLHLLRPTHAVIVVSLADPGIRAKGVETFARVVREEIAIATPGAPETPRQVVAIGGAARGLAEAHASYGQATRAAKVADTVSGFGEVISWDNLGIYKMLTEIPIDLLGTDVLHPGLGALLESPRSRELVATLECYLDAAGDMQRTAASLFLHRTSLYHRLRRIESVAGIDLGSGEDRLALHLSLKLARLQGASWWKDVDDPPAGQRPPPP